MTFIGLLVFLFALSTIDAQNECSNPRATCINIRQCPPILDILRGSRPLSAQALQSLREAQCGFQNRDPMVCCVNQQSPITPMTLDTPTPTPITTTITTANTENELSGPPDVTNHPNLRLLNHEVCGPFTPPKIFGGNKTTVFEFPWMALIAYDTGRANPEFRCGGTIISSRYILTAAHCVTALPQNIAVIGVRVGDHDISKERDCDLDERGLEIACAERYQDFTADRITFHPGYSRGKLQDDVALIRVNDTIDFRPLNVRPICLPVGAAATLNQKKAIVTGWGATELGPRSQALLQAKLPLVTQEDCQDAYRGRTEIWHKQLCAGGQNNVDSCAGDSGGPLQAPAVYRGKTVRTVQYGIVSYGLKQCGIQGFPGVYTKVANYMDWILDNMRN